jgi:pimeloyl-ACP methyl ester carboxylesterase
MELAVSELGAGPPLVILHGLFGSARNWAGIAKVLAARRRVLAVDLRNHGASPWSDAMGYADMAGDVAALIEARGFGRAAVLGHSMGGKAAMWLALTRPAAVERLVVVDVAPASYPPVLLDYVHAMQAVDLGAVRRRADADAALQQVVRDPAERGFLLQNLMLEEGGARWRLNLDVLERTLPDIAGWRDPPGDCRYDGPALFVAGARSDYVQAAHDPRIRALFPAAEVVRIADAGHWVHAEQPQAFIAAVAPFLD